DQDLLGKEDRPGRKPATPDSGKKKGRVYSVRGQDVFIELPGGRTQGLLAVEQFPDGPPAPGTEVEVHIEGFDNANGLLILTRLRVPGRVARWAPRPRGEPATAPV